MLQLSTPVRHRYPIAYQTVDVAILSDDKKNILLCKKKGVRQWQFVGGFSDPKCKSLEKDAKREVKEETNLDVNNITYIGSSIIDDERYMIGPDKIKTAFFIAKAKKHQPASAMDDIELVSWFPIKNLWDGIFVKKHRVLFKMLKKRLDKIKKLW